MLKLFRRFRKRLLTNNKFSKYLLYAVGEVILVVLGILVALQVNNWNEDRKERRFEQKMLWELHTSIQNNIQYLDRAIDENKKARQSSQLILSYLESSQTYHDSLDFHFSKALFWFHPSLTNDAYESLKSYGLHLISNDSIRKKLGDIYEWTFLERFSDRQEEYFNGTVAPLLVNWFDSYKFSGSMKPLDYEQLRESPAYKHILRTMISNRTEQINLHELGRQSRLTLTRMIEEELDSME
ncbi:DUF6090 family protein [Robiginitalea sp. IMCC44478]|uniref:DUF6090 family protein n=1 Tax=Robiginitalea sp. IMCC44478 TaxID=3459122 RepID=UPI00404190C8